MVGEEAELEVIEDAEEIPIVTTIPRPIPHHMRDEANKVVDQLINAGIIEPVYHPTTYCSTAHFVAKSNGGVRMVNDFRPVNRILKRPIKPFAGSEQIKKDLSPNAKCYAVIDMTSGYYQVPLKEQYRDLTTFVLPKGRFRFCVLPMGLSPSSDIFNNWTDVCTSNLLDCHKQMDDILLEGVGHTLQEARSDLMKKLRKLFSNLDVANAKISTKKFQIGTCVDFGGFTIKLNKETMEPEILPDKAKIAAIEAIAVPKTKKEAESLLGSVRQLGTWSGMTTVNTVHLRAAVRKDIEYKWGSTHQQEFEKIKQMLRNLGGTTPFVTGHKTEMFTDASRLGLAYVLTQLRPDGRRVIISCGSCVLTDAQTRYSTCELEMLAVQFGINKCSYWLKGMVDNFTVYSDHKPLEALFRKQLSEFPSDRLQAIAEKVQWARFDIKFIAGGKNCVADLLSRHPSGTAGPDNVPRHFHLTAKVQTRCNTRDTDASLTRLAKEAEEDPDYMTMIKAIKDGSKIESLPSTHPAREMASKWPHVAIESVGDKELIVCEGSQILIPKPARQRLLADLHSTHLSGEAMWRTIKSTWCWPGLKRALMEKEKNCTDCQIHKDSKTRPTPVIPDSVYNLEPMERVSVDVFHSDGKRFLAMVDRFSCFRFCEEIKSEATEDVCSVLSKWFSQYGFPSA